MCACRQKKSFLIEDILQDASKKPYKNLSNEPTQPLKCRNAKATPINDDKEKAYDAKDYDEKTAKFNVIREVEADLSTVRAHLEQRRNTYPLYPTALKPSLPWSPYRVKDQVSYTSLRASESPRHSFSYYSEPSLHPDPLLRSQLAANRFVSHPFPIRHAFGFERVPPNWCSPWWGVGGRRKGGQVRFSATQTGALERRFGASKYLSPDERRALAATLRLSDRQVKTWFQNRRAKWRRTTPDSADAGSPLTADECSDDEVQIADDD